MVKKLNIKYIFTLHDIQLLHPSGLMYYGREGLIDTFHAHVYQRICAFLVGSPDIVISPSRWLLDLYAKRGFFKDSKKEVLRNPINFDLECRINGEVEDPSFAKATEDKDKKFVFLSVGQIEEHKGVGFLVKVFSKIKDKYPNTKLKFLGDGSRLAYYQDKFRDIDTICFLGRKTREEVKETMEKSNCFLIASNCYENSPSVIYEAAACGLPVIGSRIGGMAELLHDFGGMLFEPDNEAELKGKLLYALENPEALKEIGERSKQKFSSISPANYVKRLEEMI